MTTTAPADYLYFARSLGTEMSFAPGEVIFRENDPPRYVYFVASGSVEMSVRERPIEVIGAGQAVGLLGMIDEQPRSVSATAREACDLIVLDRKKFRYMVEEAPNFVWYVLGELGVRLRAANNVL